CRLPRACRGCAAPRCARASARVFRAAALRRAPLPAPRTAVPRPLLCERAPVLRLAPAPQTALALPPRLPRAARCSPRRALSSHRLGLMPRAAPAGLLGKPALLDLPRRAPRRPIPARPFATAGPARKPALERVLLARRAA